MRPTSPSSFVSHDRPITPTDRGSIFSDLPASSPYSSTSDVDPDNPYGLREGDTEPTYQPNTEPGADPTEDDDDEVADGEMILGCQHYTRNVKVQCFECRRWYTCRHCHDAAEDHNLNRRRTQNMLCMACGSPQRASDHCRFCETVAACYYCDICKLWDNSSKKKIYHCPDCGICRKGEGIGKDFYHCKVRRTEHLLATTDRRRTAMSAYPYHTPHPTNASHTLPSLIAQSAGTICLPLLSPLYLCHAGIIFTRAATICICRLHTNVPYAPRVP